MGTAATPTDCLRCGEAAAELRRRLHGLGFDTVGFAAVADAVPGGAALRAWLAGGEVAGVGARRTKDAQGRADVARRR